MTELARRILACITMLALLGAAEAVLRGLSPFRLALLNVIALGWAVVPLPLLTRRLRCVSAGVEGTAAGIVLWVVGMVLYPLRNDWALFTLRPSGLIALVLVIAGSLVALAGLRASLAAVLGRVPAAATNAFVAWAALVLAAGIGTTAWPEPEPRLLGKPDAPRPNLVLVTIETLRADHLSAYGYGAHETRTLDRVASEGARFEAAFAPAPWTLASLASLMTAHAPSVLGIGRHSGVPRDVPTLASSLADAGYFTQAIVTNVFLYRNYGLDAGFLAYDHLHDLGAFDDLEGAPLQTLLRRVKLKWLGQDARRLTALATRFLEERTRASSSPFFLWLHYFDPHQPYGERSAGDLPCESRDAPSIGGYFDDARRVIHGLRTLTPDEQRHLVHLYDSDIRFLDRELAPLLDALNRPELADTLLVVTSDHGEEFWDHGGYEHGHSLHREVTRVPLLIRWPGTVAPGTVIDVPVSLLDVMPTLLRAAGHDAPPGQGTVLPFTASTDPRPPVLSENILYGPEQKAARDDTLSVLLATGAGTTRVYDRRRDPNETEPLDPEAGTGLRAWIEDQGERNRTLRTALGLEGKGAVALSRFQTEQLRSLGYVLD